VSIEERLARVEALLADIISDDGIRHGNAVLALRREADEGHKGVVHDYVVKANYT